MKGHTVERRRGKALEDAVLDAAWSELLDGGLREIHHGGLWRHAQRTSRPVLYRRWPNRADLAIAAIRHILQQRPVNAPDTGNVRDDLIALLRTVLKRNRAEFVVLSFQMSEYFLETNTSLADLRRNLLQGGHSQIDVVLARGVDRGEIDRSRLTPRIRSLLPDLLRHEFLMTLRPVSNTVITELVDDIFLPLVRPIPSRERKK